MKTKMLIAALVVMAAWCATPAWAQFATVKGRVIDKDGSPVAGAAVELINMDNGRKYPAKTDNRGDYYSITIPIGNYDITVKKDDKLLSELKNAPVTTAHINVYDFNLGAPSEGGTAPPSKEAEKQAAEIKAQNAKEEQNVKGLNDTIKAARDAEDKGNFDDAIQMLTKATQVDSTRDVVWGQLGLACLGGGKKAKAAGDKSTSIVDFSQGVNALKRAIELKSTNAAYHSLLAQTYSQMGKLPETKSE